MSQVDSLPQGEYMFKSGIDGYLPEGRESKRLRSDDIDGIGELCASRDGMRKESYESEGD